MSDRTDDRHRPQEHSQLGHFSRPVVLVHDLHVTGAGPSFTSRISLSRQEPGSGRTRGNDEAPRRALAGTFQRHLRMRRPLIVSGSSEGTDAVRQLFYTHHEWARSPSMETRDDMKPRIELGGKIVVSAESAAQVQRASEAFSRSFRSSSALKTIRRPTFRARMHAFYGHVCGQ